VFIPSKLYCFQKRKGHESPLLVATLMGNKYFLYIINEIISIGGPLRDLVYTYEYRKIITSDMNDSHNYSRWKDIIVYHAFNIFILGVRLELGI
jgi:hypothetical protein